ncbi:unnamed protein product, partial [Allacma fusca]
MVTAILHAICLVLALTSSICLANEYVAYFSVLAEDITLNTPAAVDNTSQSQSPPTQLPTMTAASIVAYRANSTSTSESDTRTTVGIRLEDATTTFGVTSFLLV